MDDHDLPYSQYDITTVGELIDAAFGNPRTNVVHHKMVEVILYILANHLRLLQRKMYVNVPIELTDLGPTESTLLVTEVSLHANVGEYDPNQDFKKPGSEKKDLHWKTESTKKGDREKSEWEKKDERGRFESDNKDESEKSKTERRDGRGRFESDYKDESEKSKTEQRRSELAKEDELRKNEMDKKKYESQKSESEQKGDRLKYELEKKDGHKRSELEKKDELWESGFGKKDERWEAEYGKKDGRRGSQLELKDELWKSKYGRKKSGAKETQDGIPEERTSLPRQPEAPEQEIDKTRRIPGLPAGYSIVPDNLKYTINAKVYFAMFGNTFKSATKPLVPVKSLDFGKTKYGKMLVVERVTTKEAKIQAARDRTGARKSDSSISIVTQEQFQKLTALVRRIQRAFGVVQDKTRSSENMQLMQELRRGSSLTDGKSALQLSARLEETERMIANLLPLVTEMAIQFGINMEDNEELQLLFGKMDGKMPSEGTFQSGSGKEPEISKPMSKSLKKKTKENIMSGSMTLGPLQQLQSDGKSDANELTKNGVTDVELEAATRDLYNEIMKTITTSTTHSSNNAQDALKTITTINYKLSSLAGVEEPMEDLERIFKDYADKINYIDSYLSKEMAANQEELTLMEHYVENGIEAMTEMLAATSCCDPALITALNTHFNDLQIDLEEAQIKQNLLKTIQSNYSLDLKSLRTQLDQLASIKASRDEVAEALKGKVGIGELNGLASLQQFSAVRGDLEKRIAESYDKFNNQEITWQKLLDDCEKSLNDKVDIRQLNHLMEQVDYHTTCLDAKVKFISVILGEYKEPEYSRPLYREGPCLSCSNPFIDMKKHIDSKSSKSKKQQGAEARSKSGHGLKCTPGYPVPHPIDPKASICRRWCGGSHTNISNIARAPPGVLITNLSKKLTKEMGLDGKMYAVEDANRPCSQCQFVRDVSPASSVDLQGEQNKTEVNIQPISPKSTVDSTSHDNPYNQEEIDEKEGIEDH